MVPIKAYFTMPIPTDKGLLSLDPETLLLKDMTLEAILKLAFTGTDLEKAFYKLNIVGVEELGISETGFEVSEMVATT